MIRWLLGNIDLKDKYSERRLGIDRHFALETELIESFIEWVQAKIPTMKSFYVDSDKVATQVAHSVEDTSVITFAFNCKRLVQGWNAVMLSHVLYLYWERSDAFLLQSMGRALRIAKEKTEPWCVYVCDDARRYTLLLEDFDPQPADDRNADRQALSPKESKTLGSATALAARKKRKQAPTTDLDLTSMHRVLTACGGKAHEPMHSFIAAGIFKEASMLPEPPWPARFGHQVVVLRDHLLVIGGRGRDGYLRDIWESSNAGDSWEQLPCPPWAERKGHQAVVIEDRVLVLGGCGSDGYMYDAWISSDRCRSWEQLPPPPWGDRHGHQAVVGDSGSLFVLGGGRGSEYLQDVWMSVDSGRTWLELPRAPWVARCGHQATFCAGHLLVTGGRGPAGYLQDAWISRDAGRSWQEMPATPWLARHGHQVVMLGGGVLLLGGVGIDGYFKDAWASNDLGCSWKTVESPPWSARVFHQVVVLDGGQVLVLGGLQWRASSSLEEYIGTICVDAWVTRSRIVA